MICKLYQFRLFSPPTGPRPKTKTKQKNLKSALLHQIVGGHQTQKRPNAEAEFRGDLLLKLVRPICTRKVLWINQMIAA